MTTERETEAERVIRELTELNSKFLMVGSDYSDTLLNAANLIKRLLAANAKLCANQESTDSMNEPVVKTGATDGKILDKG